VKPEQLDRANPEPSHIPLYWKQKILRGPLELKLDLKGLATLYGLRLQSRRLAWLALRALVWAQKCPS
jgi:hypothetical protein